MSSRLLLLASSTRRPKSTSAEPWLVRRPITAGPKASARLKRPELYPVPGASTAGFGNDRKSVLGFGTLASGPLLRESSACGPRAS